MVLGVEHHDLRDCFRTLTQLAAGFDKGRHLADAPDSPRDQPAVANAAERILARLDTAAQGHDGRRLLLQHLHGLHLPVEDGQDRCAPRKRPTA